MRPVTDFDFAHTREAERNRLDKAHTLARWCYGRNVDAATIATAPPATLRTWARGAGLASASGETWRVAAAALLELEAWAAEHPDHPKAQRNAPEAAPEAPEAPVEPEHLAPVLPIRPAAAAPVGALPRGWDLLAALGPIARKDARCSRCGDPAITCVPVVDGRPEWRCPEHPPLPGEWGYSLNWSPPRTDDSAFHPEHPHRCYNPRCPRYEPGAAGTPMSASGLLDERAAANGKNRAPEHVRKAAREAQERRRAREKELRSR